MEPTEGFHWISVRAALSLEIKTGMKSSKGSILAVLRARGITKARTKKAAWNDLDQWMQARGLPAGKRPESWSSKPDCRGCP